MCWPLAWMLITRSVSNERHAALPALAWRKSRQRMMLAFVAGEPVPLISCLSRGLNWTERRLPSSLTNRTETIEAPALARNFWMKEVLSMVLELGRASRPVREAYQGWAWERGMAAPALQFVIITLSASLAQRQHPYGKFFGLGE